MQCKHLHTCTGHRAALYALTPGKDARHFYSAGGDGWLVEWSLDAPETGRVAATVETQVFSLASLPGKNDLLLAGNMNGGLHWIDLERPERTRNIQHHQKGVYALQIHKQWLFSAGGDGVLTRWALGEARSVESFQLANRTLRCLALSTERNELAAGASDGSIYLLDSETLTLKQRIAGAHDPSVFTVCFSPDGRFLLSGGRDAMLRVWDLEKNSALVSEQPAHLFTINHVAYAPNGNFFATASRDKTIKIWDAAGFKLLKVLEGVRDGGHFNSVNNLLWLSNEVLISCSDDRTAILWSVSA